ncbi:MAG: NAD(P)/FAD-dependent oxidoreductase [Candidatus Binatia bacterium]
MNNFEIVIIGAGFAGAATAYHLAQRGVSDILILEQESIPGFHSSGRNAAMVRQCVPDPDLATLTRDGAAFLRELPRDWPEPVSFKHNGSLLLGSGASWIKLQKDAETGRRLGIDVELWTPEQAKRHVPVLKGAEFEGAVWCGSDGVVDVHALLSGYLKAAAGKGARIRYRTQVRSIRAIDGDDLEVATDSDMIRTKKVVNASGAWANVIAQMAGARAMPLRPCRRHLFASTPIDWVDSSWPFVWDIAHDIYFRPEGAGLLLCPCDQTELPPGDPPVEEGVRELLAEKIEQFMPALLGVSIHKGWAGARTLTVDGRFVIGWDRQIANFFWVAGLGGHGMTASSSVGALAAELLIGGPDKESPPFSPERFAAR